LSLRVLIPSCTDELLEECFLSMERTQRGSTRNVIVGDNGLSASFRRTWPVPVYVDVARPFVFSAAINRLASCSGNDDLLIMGDDTTMLTPGWYDRCARIVASMAEGREYGMLNLLDHTNVETTHPWTLLAFVGTLIRRATWKEIGPMDERFTGYGYDDFDYQLRLLHAGYTTGTVGSVLIRHRGSASFGGSEKRREGTAHNRKLFADKWGWDPSEGFPPAAPHFKRQECSCTKA